MKCNRCGVEVNEPFTRRSMQLCEDCYMDLLSPRIFLPHEMSGDTWTPTMFA